MVVAAATWVGLATLFVASDTQAGPGPAHGAVVAAGPVATATAAGTSANSAAADPGRVGADRAFPRPIHLTRVRHVVIDPGHGGDNLGAVGYHGVREKALTLEVALRVKAYIEHHSDVRVTLTRDRDVSLGLRERPRLANSWSADALISIHCNASFESRHEGIEIWFLNANASDEVSRELIAREEGLDDGRQELDLPWSVESIVADLGYAKAHKRSQDFAEGLRSGLRRARPRTRFRGIRQARFGVLKEAKMPAVVLEIGYLTHPKEGLDLLRDETQTAFARGILWGLIAFDRVLTTAAKGRASARPAVAAKNRVSRKPTQPGGPITAAAPSARASRSSSASQ